ncbi:receptor kinase-like protein Xa21 [Glycine soja]|uniref:Uncharacterized protein n=1 Tax=Glycine soja TaxID=3848 RepID=A0A445G8E1_GLYSO|nr:LRR receptor-like serine/threonine-protein kinase SIK1 [Glycine max]XP_028208355.1 receptor kinase-like protein Xa21 [Glycine soja]RZB57469.1 hypothetical protein D0Y65_046227 [Glycine soja]|eukprot:XP_014625047.1 receptor kinase-like protein Xa21 [Glycine max]
MLEGPIPDGFGKVMNSLEVLDLSGNKLQGEIPSFFGNMCALQSLYLSNNKLKGEISSFFQNSSWCNRYIFKSLELVVSEIGPKRPIKPNRSEPDAVFQYPVAAASVNNIPELHKFQSLQSPSHAIISSAGFVDAQDEFVETQYYKELASIDKQHHTTVSGFIKAAREGGEGEYEIQLPNNHVNAAETQPRSYKSNPATNDWVPNSDEHQVFVSSKPNRSEST